MADTLLALAVMTFLGTGVAGLLSGWIERQASQAEARVLSTWADAGVGWLMDDFEGRQPGTTPTEIDLSTLRTTGRLAAWIDGETPWRRRGIEIWHWNAGSGQVILAAVASGWDAPVPTPAPGDGIGVVGALSTRSGETEVRGPGFVHDLAPQIGQVPHLAGPGDMVALRHVTETAASLYLHRDCTNRSAALCTMESDLAMGGRSITGVGRITSENLVTDHIQGQEGTVEIEGDLTVTGNLTTDGRLQASAGRIGAGGVKARTIDGTTATLTEVNTKILRTETLTCTDNPCPGGSGS